MRMNQLKSIAFIILLTSVIGSILYLEGYLTGDRQSNSVSSYEMVDIESWINSDPLTMESLRGKVVLVDFWTYSCVNCIRTFPYLNAWYEKYSDQDFVILGVHSPEFGFEKDVDNVAAAAEMYDIVFPIAIDNNWGTFRAFENRYWPHKYLFDANGTMRYDHIGEGGYEEMEMNIQVLLTEIGVDVSDIPIEPEDRFMNSAIGEGGAEFTRELFAVRDVINMGDSLGNGEFRFVDDGSGHVSAGIYLNGLWLWERGNDHIKYIGGDDAFYQISYRGKTISPVM